MVRSSPVPFPLAALVAAVCGLAALAGCHRDLTCTSEVTRGSGTFRGSATGTRAEADVRRESVRVACGQLCAAAGPTKPEGCVSRCAVDAESGKLGVRTTCGKETAPQ
jgi:hypothetical protein